MTATAPAPDAQVTVRRAVPEDGPALLALQARSPEGDDMVIDMINQPDFFTRLRIYENPAVFVACVGDRIVGSAACALRDVRVGGAVRRIAYTFQIFVDPDARRLGVAMTLIREREKYLRASGAVLAYGLIFDVPVSSS